MKHYSSLFVVFLIVLGCSNVFGDVCDSTLNDNYQASLNTLGDCADNSYSVLPLCDCLNEINASYAAVNIFNSSCYNTTNSTLASQLASAVNEFSGLDFSSCSTCFPLLNISFTNIILFDECVNNSALSTLCNCSVYKLPTFYSIINASTPCSSVPEATYGGSDIIPEFFELSASDYDANVEELEYYCSTTQCNETVLTTVLNISNTYDTCSSFSNSIDLNYGVLCAKNCSFSQTVSKLTQLDQQYNCSTSIIGYSVYIWNQVAQPIINFASYYPFLCTSQCGIVLSNFFDVGSDFDQCYLTQDNVCVSCQSKASSAYTLYLNVNSVCDSTDSTFIQIREIGIDVIEDLLEFENVCTPSSTSSGTTGSNGKTTSNNKEISLAPSFQASFFNICLLVALLLVIV